MRKNCLVRYATLCSVKIFILHGAARRHFHYALGHLWGGALTSVPDENTRGALPVSRRCSRRRRRRCRLPGVSMIRVLRYRAFLPCLSGFARSHTVLPGAEAAAFGARQSLALPVVVSFYEWLYKPRRSPCFGYREL